MTRKVLMLLKNHFINDNRVYKEALTLKHSGYDVEIRCLFDVGLQKQEVMDGVLVNRIQFVSRTKNSRMKQIFSLLMFAIKSVINNAEIIHCHDLDVLPIGVISKILSFGRKKLIYDAHEYETERVGIKGIWKKLFHAVEFICIKFVDATITVSDSIADEYVRLYGIAKPTVVLNCPQYFEHERNYDLFRKTFDIPDNNIIFLYQGVLSEKRGVKLLIDAFKQLNSDDKSLVLMGYGTLEKEVVKIAGNEKNIFYHPAVEISKLLEYTASADIGFVFIENTCLSYYYCAPNKLFEYIQAEIPVITSDLFELRKMIDAHGNGMFVSYDIESIVQTLNNISKRDIIKMKANIKDLKSIYNWQLQELKLLDLYRSLY